MFMYTSNPADIRGKSSSHILTRGYGVWFPSQQYISAATRNRKCEVSMWEWVEKEKGLGSGHVAWLSCFLYFSSIMRKYVYLKLLLDWKWTAVQVMRRLLCKLSWNTERAEIGFFIKLEESSVCEIPGTSGAWKSTTKSRGKKEWYLLFLVHLRLSISSIH